MQTLDELYDRLRADPVANLGRKSVTLIYPYEWGYEMGCRRWGRAVPEDLLGAVFQEWVMGHYGWTHEQGCRQNVPGFARLMSTDEREAFDLFFELRRQAIRDSGGRTSREESPPLPWNDLIAFITDEHVRNRPTLYFGPANLVDGLWAHCSGYLWAERDAGVVDSEASRFMDGFQKWVEARFPFSRGRPWNRTSDFLGLHIREQAWSACVEMIDMYRNGSTSDSLSPTAERMLQGLTKSIMESDPRATRKKVAEKWKDVVKRICQS